MRRLGERGWLSPASGKKSGKMTQKLGYGVSQQVGRDHRGVPAVENQVALRSLAFARLFGHATAGDFELGADDPGVEPFALNRFFGVEGVGGAMFVAKDDVETLV